MNHWRRGVALCALAVALLAVREGIGQTAPARPATPAKAEVVSAAPYTRTPIGEIAKLSPATNNPSSVEELKAIQARVEAVARHALPTIVNVLVSDGQGSGVIISKDGYVLTAGHVSGAPHESIWLRLSNGTLVQGVSLGNNELYDSGLVKITTPGDYPFMPVGTVSRMAVGQWVVAMGHPGGYENGRTPVVRLGKVLTMKSPTARNPEWFIQTDCPLIMGDSGGPVFDLDGRVVGINSRIGIRATSNVHVPIDTYVDTWERLARGDSWGGGGILARLGGSPSPVPPKATLSLMVSEGTTGLLITQVRPDKASERAGVQAQDVIMRLNGEIVKTFDELRNLLSRHKPGETVTLDLLRNAKPVQVKVTLDALDSN